MNERRVSWFSDKTCVLCGGSEQLELDHIDPSTKHPELRGHSTNIWLWSDKRRESELQKCQVLCHDCHSKKTVDNGENLPAKLGESNGSAKLTEKDVVQIRIELASGTMTQLEIAKIHKVSRGLVGQIKRREIWDWLK